MTGTGVHAQVHAPNVRIGAREVHAGARPRQTRWSQVHAPPCGPCTPRCTLPPPSVRGGSVHPNRPDATAPTPNRPNTPGPRARSKPYAREEINRDARTSP
jgi:hypothetical protein